jgi:hypothetical protein
MPLFIVDITKSVNAGQFEWGNRYLINAADLTDASSAVAIVAGREAEFHGALVEFTQGRVATATPFDGEYNTVPLSLTGELLTSDALLPPITTINTEVRIAGFGRPGRKYFHPFLDLNFMSAVRPFCWLDTYVSDVLDKMVLMIGDMSDNGTPIVKDLDHEWLEVVVVQRAYGYHQFNKQSPRPPE